MSSHESHHMTNESPPLTTRMGFIEPMGFLVRRPAATPENTPVPGGGRWTWNAVLGAWSAVDESAAAPQQSPVTPETEPTPE